MTTLPTTGREMDLDKASKNAAQQHPALTNSISRLSLVLNSIILEKMGGGVGGIFEPIRDQKGIITSATARETDRIKALNYTARQHPIRPIPFLDHTWL